MKLKDKIIYLLCLIVGHNKRCVGVDYIFHEGLWISTKYRYKCWRCGNVTEEEAVNAWNTRPTEDALMTSLAEIQKKTVLHPFNIDDFGTYPPSCGMYLTVSIPNQGDCYVEHDNRSVYDVMWWEAYSEEYWDEHNVTHWAYLPELPQEKRKLRSENGKNNS